MKTIVNIILALVIGARGVSAVERILQGVDIVRPVQTQVINQQDKPAATSTPAPQVLPTVPDPGDATQPCIEFQDKQCWENLRMHIQGE